MKKTICLTAFSLLMIAGKVEAQNSKVGLPIYKNPKAPIEERVKDLLSKMTIEEKAGQLNQISGRFLTGPSTEDSSEKKKVQDLKKGKIGSFLNIIGAKKTEEMQKVAVEQTRLGIPLLFAFDVIHGFKTIFPIPLAEACSWDLKQAEKNASIAAREAAAAGLHWTFAPMCDITNDPRWGRIMEGVGEDPYYGSLISAARVRGFQGNLNDTAHILACIKHYAVYGAVEEGREYNLVDISRVMLWNKYLPPYKAAVDAGAATLMNSFNVFEGVPTSGSKYLVTDVLKNKWGFKGFLVSDWGAFGEMINHGYAADKKDATQKALNAGSMMDMESRIVINFLPELVKEGRVSMATVDAAVWPILYYKFKLGLFENPYKFSNEEREKKELFTDANIAEARKAGDASIVLLKNDNVVLPIRKNSKVALIGYYANKNADVLDRWPGQGDTAKVVNLYNGLTNKLGSSLVGFTDGYKDDGTTSDSLLQQALETANNADVILVNIGISGKLAGECQSLANPIIPDGQVQLIKALQKTGKPIVALVSAGRPLILTQINDLVSSILYCWHLGTETGNCIADVVVGDYNPSAKTVVSFPYSVGQIPVYYNHFNTGRPNTNHGDGGFTSRFRDIPNEPLYPFGFGLSYTTFKYDSLRISNQNITKKDKLHVKVNVSNTGKMDGEEVVQLYIWDKTASIIRPVKELKGFKKILLKAGETKEVEFTLTDKELSFYDADGNTRLEAGAFKVFVGANSRDVLEKDFTLQ